MGIVSLAAFIVPCCQPAAHLTQINLVQVPLLPQRADLDVTVLAVQEQRLVDVLGGAFQLLPARKSRQKRAP